MHIDLLERVPNSFLILGGVFLALQLTGILIMFEYKEEESETQVVINKEIDEENPNGSEANEETNLMIKSRPGDLYNSLGVR